MREGEQITEAHLEEVHAQSDAIQDLQMQGLPLPKCALFRELS